MINIIRADQRHFNNFGWLKAYWLFSFSNYYDPENMSFGSLRVFNDDVIEPGKGFSTHPHNEMEIVTIVLEGEISHQDSMGNKGTIKAGEIQRMSAGTGLTHSEFNRADNSLHLYQIWFLPNKAKIEPSYDQKAFDPNLWQGKLYPLVTPSNEGESISINADVSIYRAKISPNEEIEFETTLERKLFIYMTDGRIDINGKEISTNDQARISDVADIKIKALEESDFILIDLK